MVKEFLTVTRGERRQGKNGHQGTFIKDTWTKPKWGRIEGGRWARESGDGKKETTVLEQQ